MWLLGLSQTEIYKFQDGAFQDAEADPVVLLKSSLGSYMTSPSQYTMLKYVKRSAHTSIQGEQKYSPSFDGLSHISK